MVPAPFSKKSVVGFPSGQRDRIVNPTRKLRWFESISHHHLDQLLLGGYGIVAITSAFQAEEAGSIPATRSNIDYRSCSSGVEHTLGKGEVGGSNPPMSSMIVR